MDKRHGKHEKCDESLEILINDRIALKTEKCSDISGAKIENEEVPSCLVLFVVFVATQMHLDACT